MKLNGEGIKKNVTEAEEWFERGKSVRHPSSMAALGNLAANRENYSLAMELYHNASTMGNSAASAALGDVYSGRLFSGRFPINHTLASRYYTRAAHHGHGTAMQRLAEVSGPFSQQNN